MKADDKRIVVKIEDLYIDPNNPRIVPIEKAKDTAIIDIKNEPVQATALKLMYENASTGIKDYVERLQKEGLLSSFPLRVAKLPGGGYVLNDGNTRVVAAKAILAEVGIGKLKLDSKIVDSLRNVTVEDVGPYGEKEWLKMQAKVHLQGPRTWASSKRAGFVMRVLRQRMTKAETLETLQVKPKVLSDYQNQLDMFFDLRLKFPKRINENHFNVLKEIVKSPSPRRYLGWNQVRKQFTNPGHVAQLLFLIAPEDGSKPRINANSSKIFRTLGDDPIMWNTYVRGTTKDLKYITLTGDRNKALNDLMMKLAQRIEAMTIKESNNFDVELANRVTSLLNRAKTQSRAVVKAAGKVAVGV